MNRYRQISCAFLLAVATTCLAQTDQPLRFEVASIKPATGIGRYSGGVGSDFATYEGVTLETLINNAYGLRLGQVSGPDWIGTEWYRVSVKLQPGATTEQFRQMLVNLLADRFALVTHRVTKEVNGYEITVAPGGPKITPSDPNAVTASAVAGSPVFERPMPDADGFPVLSANMTFASQYSEDSARMTFRQATIGLLANRLSSLLSRSVGSAKMGDTVPVNNQTGIDGKFDFHLQFPISQANSGPPYADPKGIGAAMEKQLGLRLNPVKVKFDTIVVDSANKVPTEN